MKSKAIIFLMVFFLICNILLIIQNVSLKVKIGKRSGSNIVSQEQDPLENGNRLRGRIFPLFNDLSFRVHFPEDGPNPLGRFIIFFVFLRSHCGSCIYQNNKILNEFQREHPRQECEVIGITDFDKTEIAKLMEGQKNEFPIFFDSEIEKKIEPLQCKNLPSLFFCFTFTKKIIFSYCPSPINDSSTFLRRYVEFVIAGVD